MEQITSLHTRIKDRIKPEIWQNIERFFITFSRIEFALIEAGMIRDEVFADWNAFANMISNSFDPKTSESLNEACIYLLNNPPRERRNNQWVPKQFEQNINGIFRAIKGVRNNLFHGGKFPYDPLRDDNLITACLIILDHCIDISPRNITDPLWQGI